MPKRKPRFKDPDESKLREDTAETAFRTLQEAIGELPKSAPPQRKEAVKRGGKRAARRLTRRS
jgi:hypothetical protein